jgi:hypothetical protein
MSSGGGAANREKDWSDPGGLFPVTGQSNSVRRAFFDPLAFTDSPLSLESMGVWSPPEAGETEAERQAREEAAKQTLRGRVNAMYGIGPGGESAAAQMKKEEDELANANRTYYTDELNRGYNKAERNTRFNLARRGVLGGSDDIDQQMEVQSDRDLGATRLDDAVRQSVAGLRTNREQERLMATSLINAGEGENAVLAASKGLENSLANSRTANKTQLFGDLFANSADAMAAQNANAANAALLARYKQTSSFFPAGDKTDSGRRTAT